ncbi:unnamed protein product [Cuscuta epithymum]|uniref:AP2/ERF domain-containing protein n=1 Tax=Cuscuta epithymum TaxID=186058 RepID=A0AAV0DFK1_9ASTE|nr:unnamed protein product [Cuscuta epithymum]CAH9137535.1 unnamed protein product [Cuscuta epithymum]
MENAPNDDASSSATFRGVRRREWGKWVSEIRQPNSRRRIWLGSFDSPVKAARAFDAALFCLRGRNANFNFPDNPPDIAGGSSMSVDEIKVAAINYANAETHQDTGSGPSRGNVSDHSTSLSPPHAMHADSPPQPGPGWPAQGVEGEMTQTPFDDGFLQQFSSFSWDAPINNDFTDYGYFPGLDDFGNDYYAPPTLPETNFDNEEQDDGYASQGSFRLWDY